MLRTLLAAVLLATLSGCDSGGPDRSGREPLDPALLAGTWAWEKTVSCSEGSTGCTEETPASAQRAETLTFTRLPANGSSPALVEGYFNGIVLPPTAYQVEINHADTATRPLYYGSIVLSGVAVYNETFVSQTRLAISAAAVDGSETTYRRR